MVKYQNLKEGVTMQKAIITLFFEYSKKGKLIDNSFINKILNIIMENEDLKDYLKKIEFDRNLNSNDDLSISYNAVNNNLKFNLNTSYHYQYDPYYNHFNGFERPFYINARILKRVLREIENVNVNKIILSKDEGFEAKLLKVCFSDYLTPQELREMLRNKKISNPDLVYRIFANYQEHINLNPLERYTKINATKKIIKLMELIDVAYPNLIQFELASLLEELLSGYTYRSPKVEAPTPTYLHNFYHDDFWKKQNFYDDNQFYLEDKVSDEYGLTKKLELGLPVRNYEYRETLDKLHQSFKYKKNN